MTGASRGIGRAIALALAAAGHPVVINYRSRRDEAEKTAELIRDSGGVVSLLPFDVSDRAACREAIEAEVMAHEKTKAQLQGREPKKVIVVPGKIVNIVG